MNDMTKGNPVKLILYFLLPVFLGNIFQNLYNIVDIVIVGRYLGVNAFAAVGMTGSITFLVVGWIMGITTGFGVVIAQAFGAKDYKKMRHYIAVSIYICIGLAIIMTVGLLCGNDFILHIMNTQDDIFSDTRSYIAIIYGGLSATILYNILASIARALGDSKTPLYFLAISSVINIGLDLLLIAVIPLGVAGAGYATVISQAISGILCLIYMWKKYPEIHFSKEEGKFKIKTFKKLLGMGIPMALQFSITAIGTMIVQASLNLLGSVHIAAYSGSMKIQNILMQFPIAMGAAIASYVGQNFGAMNLKRIKDGVKASIFITVTYSVIAMVLGYYVCPYLIVMFTDEQPQPLIEISKQIFHISLGFYIPLSLIFVYRNALQGLGNGVVPLLGGVAELIARYLTILLLFDSLQFVGICLADPIAWISALIPLIPYYYYYIHKIEKKQQSLNSHT